MWLTSKEFRKKYHLSSQHLYALKKSGKIETKPGIGSSYLIKDDTGERGVCVYARVSTPKQRTDLENQIRFIKEYCISRGDNPEHVFTDIASGMNENRKGLNDMMDLVLSEKVSKIVISHKYRLTLFGFGYLESICNRFGTTIEIVNLDDEKSFHEELTEDLIAIIHHFSMKFYGHRKNVIREIKSFCQKFREDEDK